MLIALFLAAHAATFTAEDLVTAHRRGLPDSAVSGILESVGRHGGTAVYLLRRGVPAEVVRGWGIRVTAAEEASALRLGRLAEATRGRQTHVDQDLVWQVDETIAEHIAWDPTARVDLYRGDIRTRGHLGIVAGALLGAAGGITVAFAARGGWDESEVPAFAPGTDLVFSNAGAVTMTPRLADGPLMVLGGAGLVAGAVSVSFGMGQLRLAGLDRDLPEVARALP